MGGKTLKFGHGMELDLDFKSWRYRESIYDIAIMQKKYVTFKIFKKSSVLDAVTRNILLLGYPFS